jgi:hypothetical protein
VGSGRLGGRLGSARAASSADDTHWRHDAMAGRDLLTGADWRPEHSLSLMSMRHHNI